MGLSLFGGSSGNYSPPNPNPNNFRIVRSKSINGLVVVEVRYPDCTTYDGHKILVYDDVNVINRKHLDPHFLGSKNDPIARFPATPRGWEDATLFAYMRLPY